MIIVEKQRLLKITFCLLAYIACSSNIHAGPFTKLYSDDERVNAQEEFLSELSKGKQSFKRYWKKLSSKEKMRHFDFSHRYLSLLLRDPEKNKNAFLDLVVNHNFFVGRSRIHSLEEAQEYLFEDVIRYGDSEMFETIWLKRTPQQKEALAKNQAKFTRLMLENNKLKMLAFFVKQKQAALKQQGKYFKKFNALYWVIDSCKYEDILIMSLIFGDLSKQQVDGFEDTTIEQIDEKLEHLKSFNPKIFGDRSKEIQNCQKTKDLIKDSKYITSSNLKEFLKKYKITGKQKKRIQEFSAATVYRRKEIQKRARGSSFESKAHR